MIRRAADRNYALTFERVNEAVAHDVPELRVADLRRDDEMLLGRRQHNRPEHAGARDGHRADLRRQRHRQPPGQRDQQRHRVAVAPGRRRAHRDAQQRRVALVVLRDRPQPRYQLAKGGHGHFHYIRLINGCHCAPASKANPIQLPERLIASGPALGRRWIFESCNR